MDNYSYFGGSKSGIGKGRFEGNANNVIVEYEILTH